MAPKDFGVFIITNRRPRRQLTLKVLLNNNYTGPVYLLVDDQDPTLSEYQELYGDMVCVFDKEKAASITDIGINTNERRSTAFARNASFGIARELGYKRFLQLDDDYTFFAYSFDNRLQYKYTPVRNLDEVFGIMLEFLDSTPVTSIAFAQSEDFIGGAQSGMSKQIWAKRKAMNSFFCHIDRPFSILGLQNEDVNAYALHGSRGVVFLQINHVRLNQSPTQSTEGGMTEIYLEMGTYVKSFYTVMHCPSFTRVKPMGPSHPRLHHQISWRHAVPKIIREEHRKDDLKALAEKE
jgi:hypothetical protein